MSGRHARRDELEMLHLPEYIDSVQEFCAAGGGYLTQSTPVVEPTHGTPRSPPPGPRSRRPPRSSTASATWPMRSSGRRAITPSPTGPTGTASSRTRRWRRSWRGGGASERVAVIDWDVHHGNGTQACFWDRGDVLAVSFHMRHGSWGPSHPQTGSPDEVGTGDGAGRNVNVELPVGTGDEGYRRATARAVEPLVDAFEPELIVIACGQDASQFDPNGRMCVTMDGFRGLGAAARALADRHCGGRMVLVQEGGYGRTYSGHCMHATLEGVLGTGPLLDDPMAYIPDDADRADAAIAAVRSRDRTALGRLTRGTPSIRVRRCLNSVARRPRHRGAPLRPCRSTSAPDPGRSSSTSARPRPAGSAWCRRSLTP